MFRRREHTSPYTRSIASTPPVVRKGFEYTKGGQNLAVKTLDWCEVISQNEGKLSY